MMEATVSEAFSLAPEEIKPYNFEPLLNNTHGSYESDSEDSEDNGVEVNEGENAEGGISNRKESLEWYGNKTLFYTHLLSLCSLVVIIYKHLKK